VLSLAALCGCASLHPVSVAEELARPKAPIVRSHQAIEGYFDDHGLYRRTGGWVRQVDDSTLQLRRATGMVTNEVTRIPATQIRTLIVPRTRVWPFVVAFLAPIGIFALLVAGYD
jgi:hypothetical protein